MKKTLENLGKAINKPWIDPVVLVPVTTFNKELAERVLVSTRQSIEKRARSLRLAKIAALTAELARLRLEEEIFQKKNGPGET